MPKSVKQKLGYVFIALCWIVMGGRLHAIKCQTHPVVPEIPAPEPAVLFETQEEEFELPMPSESELVGISLILTQPPAKLSKKRHRK